MQGPHLFIDETKSDGFVMAAAAMLPGDVAAARKVLRAQLLPGAERLHFAKERPARRGPLLDVMCELRAEVRLYVARTKDHRSGREACIKAIVEDALVLGATRLTFEADDSMVAGDKRLLSSRLRAETAAPIYTHMQPKQEPLLWISDAVAWCHQRGGEWIRRCEPLVVATNQL